MEREGGFVCACVDFAAVASPASAAIHLVALAAAQAFSVAAIADFTAGQGTPRAHLFLP